MVRHISGFTLRSVYSEKFLTFLTPILTFKIARFSADNGLRCLLKLPNVQLQHSLNCLRPVIRLTQYCMGALTIIMGFRGTLQNDVGNYGSILAISFGLVSFAF